MESRQPAMESLAPFASRQSAAGPASGGVFSASHVVMPQRCSVDDGCSCKKLQPHHLLVGRRVPVPAQNSKWWRNSKISLAFGVLSRTLGQHFARDEGAQVESPMLAATYRAYPGDLSLLKNVFGVGIGCR